MSKIQDQRLALFDGNTKSSNDTIAYFVEQTKNTYARLQACIADINQAQEQLDALHERRVELRAVRQKYLEDIEFWLKKEQDAEKEEDVELKSKAVADKMQKLDDAQEKKLHAEKENAAKPESRVKNVIEQNPFVDIGPDLNAEINDRESGYDGHN